VRFWVIGIAVLISAPGCVVVQVGVTNPVPGLSTVAVAPFFNLSNERATDGRRFASAYFAELQATPGFQVVPVGVTEQAIAQNELEMNNPRDVLKLAKILGVDAVVVGAVTDYDPYYPPRIGLQVSWYSAKSWEFSPGLPTDMYARRMFKHRDKYGDVQGPEHPFEEDGWERFRRLKRRGRRFLKRSKEQVIRSQSDDEPQSRPNMPASLRAANAADCSEKEECSCEEESASAPELVEPFRMKPHNPLEPFMSYTRIYSGSDADLVAALRDYIELNGDQRSGGWEGYLQRSEDFIRFTAHMMIVEMLTEHGGEAKRRIVFKHRNRN